MVNDLFDLETQEVFSALQKIGYELTSFSDNEFEFDKKNSEFHIKVLKNEDLDLEKSEANGDKLLGELMKKKMELETEKEINEWIERGE